MNKETQIKILKISLLCIIILLIAIYNYNNMNRVPLNRWGPFNHCDALCYGEYGIHSRVNSYHNESTVIPLKISSKGWDKYICICDEGNITTRWTYI